VLLSPEEAASLTSVTLTANGETRPLDFRYVTSSKRLVVRAPKVAVAANWTITFK
jgi:hypothetical protein